MIKLNKILVANRGEIAVKIIKTVKEMGLTVSVIYSELDCNSLHVRLADESYLLEGSELKDTYLNFTKIIEIAKDYKCDAIHPGYGFLSENYEFAKKCEEAGIIFIGPKSDSIKLMGDKLNSRELAKSLEVPVLEEIKGSLKDIINNIDKIVPPYLVKPSGGGGGKGMKIVRSKNDLHEAINTASREGKAFFNNDSVFIEHFIENGRHIEVQVLGDNFGNIVHLFERECSIQRRYQKIIEETPCISISNVQKENLYDAAIKIAKAADYSNAGTVEFIIDENDEFFFLEMNTRIQVEHPVTELTTGIDIVKEQIKIASGEKLSVQQDKVKQSGHAIEARIYAEDPNQGWIPSPGKINFYQEPELSNVRIDSSIDRPSQIFPNYDPLISKVIAHGNDRQEALRLLDKSLKNYNIHGVSTDLQYLRYLLSSEDFIQNKISTSYCNKQQSTIVNELEKKSDEEYIIAAIMACCYSKTISTENNSVWNKIGHWRHINSQSFLIDDTEVIIQEISSTTRNCIIKIDELERKISDINLHMNKLSLQLDGRKIESIVSETDNIIYIQLDKVYNVKRKWNLYSNDIKAVESKSAKTNLYPPMPGKVISLLVDSGDKVKIGDELMIIEAMKMENKIISEINGVVKKINVSENEQVKTDTKLIELKFDHEE